MKLLLLLLGANALVDGFTGFHGVKFREVPNKRADVATWRKVSDSEGIAVWQRSNEQLEAFGVPVTSVSFVEGQRGSGVSNVIIETAECPAMLKAVTAAWGEPSKDSSPGHAEWLGSNIFADLELGSDCTLSISSLRWNATKHVWKK